MVKDLVNNICKEASDIAVCKQLLSDRLENCRIAEDPINSVAPKSTFILSATNNIPNEIRENAKKSLVVNLYGGPGAGKSTAALQLDTSVPFENEGRIHNLEESMEKDGEILSLLNSNNIKFEMFDRDNISKIAEENSHRLSAESEPELTEMEQAFINYDIESVMAKSPLAWDEIEDIGYILFGEKYINKYPASEKAIYGNGLHEPELYDIARRMQDGEDIRKELVSALLGGQKSFTTPNNNTFKVEYGESDIIAKYGNAQKSVSYEALGDAFLSLIKGEYNDIVNARTIEGLKYDISDITEEKAESLIKAFDGAALHGWEKGDNQPKINRIKKALFNILGDEEQTEKAFNDIAWDKYDVKIEDKNADELNFHFGYADHDDDWFTESNLLGDFVEEHPNMSFALANSIMEYLDEKQHSERDIKELNAGWYKKTNFVITARVDRQDFHFADRFDIGDGKGTGGGSLIDHIKTICENIVRTNQYPYNTPESKEKATSMLEKFVPFLEKHSALTPDEQKILNEFKMNNPIRTAFDIEINKNLSEKTEVKQSLLAENTEKALPTITCEWSESNVFEDGKTYSIYEFDSLMKQADSERIAGQKAAIEKYGSAQAWYNDDENNEFTQFYGYDKVKFTVNMPDGTSYTERQDIGDGYGGVIDFLSHYPVYNSIISELKTARELQAQEQSKEKAVDDVSAVTLKYKGDSDYPKNLSQLKKTLKPGMKFEIIDHLRPECIGERRVITSVNPVGFTSQKLDDNDEPSGKDIHMEWDKAKNWSFEGSKFFSHIDENQILMSFCLVDGFERTKTQDQNKIKQQEYLEMDKAVKSENSLSIIQGEPTYKVGDHVEVDYGGKHYSGKLTYVGDIDVTVKPDNGYSWELQVMNREYFESNLRKDSRNAELFVDKPYAFHITDDSLGEGGVKAKFKANIAAIQTLQIVEAENRPATTAEQEIMSHYVGWGGLAAAFDEHNSSWTAEYKQLKELISNSEYTSARASTLDSFYTSPVIIDGIYEALDNFGFHGGNVLEPACGVGNFFGRMPEKMQKNSKLYGVELDSISGRIAALLYPQANIQVKGFEQTKFSDNTFDVVIGNIPFGNIHLHDKKYDKLNLPIHDYFIAKSIDQACPGGIIAVITSKFTMDKKDSRFREYIAERCELLGAVRLPNTAFKNNANTETTTDILFLQKRESKTVVMPRWVKTDLVWEKTDKSTSYLKPTEQSGIRYNTYFIDNPDMVLGEMVIDKRMQGKYGDSNRSTTCIPDNNSSLRDQLQKVIANIHGQFRTGHKETNYKKNEHLNETISADPDVKNYTYTVIDGEVYFRETEIMVKPNLSKKTAERIIGLHALRQTTLELIDAESNGCNNEEMEKLQLQMNEVYDRFISEYGYINSSANLTAFKDDDDYNLLCALEKKAIKDKEAEKDKYLKADIFFKRTIRPISVITSVNTAEEALQVSLDKVAKVDIHYMAQLLNSDEQFVVTELEGKIYKNPLKENSEDIYFGYEEAAEYLSGNVREKLKVAKTFLSENPEYQRNIDALEKVIPEDIPAENISIRISANWISCDDYNKFFEEYAKSETSLTFSPHIVRTPLGEYKWQNLSTYQRSSEVASVIYGTSRMDSFEIFSRLLNQRDIVVRDAIEDSDNKVKYVINEKETRLAKDKSKKMQRAFKDWIWSDSRRRSKYVTIYNEKFNSIVGREYDGGHQTFEGMNPSIELKKHQKDAVMRAKLSGNTLLAHVVGAGKSFEMVAVCMEKRRLGLINKACVTVPKALVEQCAIEWTRLYPKARLLIATAKDFSKDNRQKFMSRAATGDYDAVIMSYEQFCKIPMSAEYQREFINQQIGELDETIKSYGSYTVSQDNKISVKALERAKKNLENQLKKLLDTKRDSMAFEKLGFDFLVVDEAHYFKNCHFATKMSNISGIAVSPSMRAEDMLLKTAYLNNKYHSNNVLFATGTPVANSMVELYVMMRYLAPEVLQSAGLVNFDDWAATFGEVVNKIEPKPEGSGYRNKNRFAKFVNLPELISMYKTFTDIKTADMINLDVPKIKGGQPTVVVSQPDEWQKRAMKIMAQRANAIHLGAVNPDQDNMLKLTHDARLLGLDSRTFYPDAVPGPENKINKLCDNIMRYYESTSEELGVQVVFCDIAVHSNNGHFSAYEAIKEELIMRGMPKDEICFAGDVGTDEKEKIKQHEDLRNGKKRLVIGSTGKLGTGVNIQDRLCAIHHLDIAWKPSDFEQRNGRGIRQGNKFKEVEIFHYVTQDTFDLYMMETIVRKQKFISQVMTSKAPARVCEDMDDMTLTYKAVQAATTSNPLIVERIELESDIQNLKLLKSEYQKSLFKLQDKVEKDIPKQIETYSALMEKSSADLDKLKNNCYDNFCMEIQGKIVNDKNRVVDEMIKAKMICSQTHESISVGKYRGFEIKIEENNSLAYLENLYSITAQGELSYRCELGDNNGLGNITRLENLVEVRVKATANDIEETLKNLKRDLEELEKTFSKPFEYEDELIEKEERFELVTQMLSENKECIEILSDEVEDDMFVSDSESCCSCCESEKQKQPLDIAAKVNCNRK